jgi:hypothetical protein
MGVLVLSRRDRTKREAEVYEDHGAYYKIIRQHPSVQCAEGHNGRSLGTYNGWHFYTVAGPMISGAEFYLRGFDRTSDNNEMFLLEKNIGNFQRAVLMFNQDRSNNKALDIDDVIYKEGESF